MLEIDLFRPFLVKEVAEFFLEIHFSHDLNFKPHTFSIDEATRLCEGYVGKDLYYAVMYNKKMIAYGLLRGWDEGYEVPSLGIYVSKKYRGKGVGRMLMEYLHCAARLKGANSIMLKVNKENDKARKLYESLGYIFEEYNSKQLIGRRSL